MNGRGSRRLLIEEWLPVAELGIESRRESSPIPGQFPKLKTLHVWWARRPLVASAAAVLSSLLPAWSEDLAKAFPGEIRVASDATYKKWFLYLCGIWGDPVAAKQLLDAANATGVKLVGNGYGYKQAYKNCPTLNDVALLHGVLEWTWGALPSMADPTAGGGSIPYEASRYGIPAIANDLNPVAAITLRAGVEVPAIWGSGLDAPLRRWGDVLVARLRTKLTPFFVRENEQERVVAYLFARAVACPRTGKPVPLSPNWWISKSKGDACAAQIVTERNGEQLDAPEFQLLYGPEAEKSNPDKGTVSGGDGLSPWDGLVIDGDYIKAEAQAGRMGSIPFGVAIRVPTTTTTGRTKWVRQFRSPTHVDLAALEAAEEALQLKLPEWLARGILPAEDRFIGFADRSANYGMLRWIDMFSSRQLLVHGTFVEELQALIPEIEDDLGKEKGAAIVGVLGLMAGKALNWNALLSSWDTGRTKIRSVFDRHDFAFKWSYAEFEGAEAIWSWALDQTVDGLNEIVGGMSPSERPWTMAGETIVALAELRHPVPAPVKVLRRSAGDLSEIEPQSQSLVCIDPPYYDNVMYGELSDFFGVWEQHTIGRVWPDLMPGGTADLKNEAVANPARFREFGRRRNDMANSDYEAKMQAIFAECNRILRDDGVMTVMFTHKKAEAWDTLGMALLDAGFSIETSWPVNTESEQSLHQAKKNAAASTIMLVCRKRPNVDDNRVYFEDVESDVRHAAREAVERFKQAGIDGVDLLLATYGPSLSVLSRAWPVYSAETDESGRSRLLRPEEALAAAREEVVRIRKADLVGHDVTFDATTDFTLLAWRTFQAEEFPYDEARRLALAIGGGDIDDLAAETVLEKKSGTVRLLAPKDRKRRVYRDVLEGHVGGRPLIDVLHAVMIEASESGFAAAKALCDRLGVMNEQRFIDVIQAMVRAVPNTKQKGKWIRPEAEILHGFCTAYLPQVELPEEPAATTLFETS